MKVSRKQGRIVGSQGKKRTGKNLVSQGEPDFEIEPSFVDRSRYGTSSSGAATSGPNEWVSE